MFCDWLSKGTWWHLCLCQVMLHLVQSQSIYSCLLKSAETGRCSCYKIICPIAKIEIYMQVARARELRLIENQSLLESPIIRFKAEALS